jgi:hypothetical protein
MSEHSSPVDNTRMAFPNTGSNPSTQIPHPANSSHLLSNSSPSTQVPHFANPSHTLISPLGSPNPNIYNSLENCQNPTPISAS